MSEIVIRELPAAEYAPFLDTVPHSAFHRLAWLNAIAKAYPIRVRLLGYYRASKLCAVTPLIGKRVGPFILWGAPLRKCGIPPATPFCSPSNEALNLITAFGQWVSQQRITYVQATLPGGEVPDLLQASRIEALDNLELGLDYPLTTIWRNLTQQKASVRKAVKMRVKVHYRSSADLLHSQMQLVSETYGRQGIHPNFPGSLYRELLNAKKANCLRILSATHDGKVVAAIWALSDGDKCYYWDAAALGVARQLNANHLLLWCLIRWAHRKKLGTLDFVGALTGGRASLRPGITQFKLSMGAKPVPYRLVYWCSPLMQVALLAYRLAHRLSYSALQIKQRLSRKKSRY